MGFADEGYTVTVLGVPYPFYADEFPHHRAAYDRRFESLECKRHGWNR